MKTLFRLLIVIWLLLISLTQVNTLNATFYNTLTLRGVILDVSNLQQQALQNKNSGPTLQKH
jgi:hypothetical protein